MTTDVGVEFTKVLLLDAFYSITYYPLDFWWEKELVVCYIVLHEKMLWATQNPRAKIFHKGGRISICSISVCTSYYRNKTK